LDFNLTGGSDWLDVNWDYFSLSSCMFDEGKDLVGRG
jgi:hypothetical protein